MQTVQVLGERSERRGQTSMKPGKQAMNIQ